MPIWFISISGLSGISTSTELCFFEILHPHPKGAIVLLVLIPADMFGVIEESRLVLLGLDVITLEKEIFLERNAK